MVCAPCWVLPTLLSPDNLQQWKVNQHTRGITIVNLRFQNNEELALVISRVKPIPPLQPVPVTSLPSSISKSWGETACSHSVPAGRRVKSQSWVPVPLSTLLSNGSGLSWATELMRLGNCARIRVPMWDKRLENFHADALPPWRGNSPEKLGRLVRMVGDHKPPVQQVFNSRQIRFFGVFVIPATVVL